MKHIIIIIISISVVILSTVLIIKFRHKIVKRDKSYEFYNNNKNNNKNNKNKVIHRYSSINGVCKKTTKYMGNNILGIPIKGYHSKEKCIEKNDSCHKYNKQDCLKQDKCGYCSNNKNGGMCLSSTPDGPIDLQYNMCHPSSGSTSSNKFTMGASNGFILTKTHKTDYNPTIPPPKKSSDYNLLPMV